jgi:hypothetical protein
MDENIVTFDSCRRFGAEFEFCSFDHRDFKKYPLDHGGELPVGIHDMAQLLVEQLKVQCFVNKWHHTHNNNQWVLKPDSSAGIEVCSPVVKGWHGISHICDAVEAFKLDDRIKVDEKCGFHVHVEVADCQPEEVASILTYPYWLIETLGDIKYYTLNTFHYAHGKRFTVEFRIAEGNGCLDSYLVKNWIRLLVHFVERAKTLPFPEKYKANDPWTSFMWLDLRDVMKLLGFDQPLSKGLEETRNWFLARIANNVVSDLRGIWQPAARLETQKQLLELVKEYNIKDLSEYIHPTDIKRALYATETHL